MIEPTCSRPSQAIVLPTLDTIADEPELAKTLPRPCLFALILRAQTVQMTCANAMLTDEKASPDEILDCPAAARALGMSRGNLYKLAHTTLKDLRIDNGTRSLRFSRARIDEYLRRSAGRTAGSAAPIASGVPGASRLRALAEPSAPSTRAPRGEPR